MRVKIFRNHDLDALEININKWLEENSKEIPVYSNEKGFPDPPNIFVDPQIKHIHSHDRKDEFDDWITYVFIFYEERT